MFRSIRLFKLAGIPVYIHWTFFILVFYIIGESVADSDSMPQLVFNVSILLTVFLCVTLHEYGHALTARKYGIQTQDIILSPIGGVARLSGLPEKPVQEFLVAIAGPMVNVVIVILITTLLAFVYPETEANYARQDISWANFLNNYLLVINVINVSLVVFNMVPAFPMDGGRVLRALLAMKLGKLKATRIASIIGQIIAALFIVIAITKLPLLGFHIDSTVEQFTLVIIGVFIFSMARTEYASVKLEDKMLGTTAADIMEPHFTHLYLDDKTDFAVSRFQLGEEREFLVFNEQDECIGVLKKEILQLLVSKEENTTIRYFYTPIETTIDKSDHLKQILLKITQSKETIFPVMDGNKVIGVIYRRDFEKRLRANL